MVANTAGKKNIGIRRSSRVFPACYSTYLLTSLLSRSHSPLTEETPSYARSTRASRFRCSQSPTSHTESTTSLGLFSSFSSKDNSTDSPKHVVIHGKPCVYQKGKLIEQDYSFLMSTKAAINRFGDLERYREEKCGIFRPSLPTSWWDALSPSAFPKITRVLCPEPPKPIQVMSREELEDRTERKGIELRTRLDDDDWLSNPANKIRMDHDELFDILSKAERLAKRCLWRWFRVNHPNTCIRMGLNYVSDMDLGRHTLESLSDSGFKMLRYRHTESDEVHQSIQDVIQLRNRVHHFNGRGFTMEITDEYLYDVQNLAVNLYDEESARSARDLRDRLRQGAEAVAGEIEALRLLIELPFAEQNPWQHHHVESFRALRESPLPCGGFCSAHTVKTDAPLVIAAAHYWKEAGCPSSPQPDIDASLTSVRRLERGGCAWMTSTEPGRQDGHATHQTSPARTRSSSMGGSGGLSLSGQQTHARDPTRRRCLSFSGSASSETRPNSYV